MIMGKAMSRVLEARVTDKEELGVHKRISYPVNLMAIKLMRIISFALEAKLVKNVRRAK